MIIGHRSDRKNILIVGLVLLVVALVSLLAWFAINSSRINPSANNPDSYVLVGNKTQFNTATTLGQYIPRIGIISQALVPVENMANYEIDVTSIGFSPGQITIKKGQSIVWTVRDKSSHWIQSNPSAPYPDSGTCGATTFDSCRGLNLGESFRMTFDRTGTWSYYDRLNPQFTGTVVVQ